jgi:hypothetical protein
MGRLTVYELRRALSIRQHQRIAKQRQNILDNEAHSVRRHNVTNRGKALGSRLSNDRVSAAKGQAKHRKDGHEFWPEPLMQSGHDGFQDAQRVDDVLAIFAIDKCVHVPWRICVHHRVSQSQDEGAEKNHKPPSQALKRPPTMDCHIFGITTNSLCPNLCESLSKARPAPRLERRAFATSSFEVSTETSLMSFPLRGGRELEDDRKDSIPRVVGRMKAKVGVCSTSWQRKVHKFFTILSGGCAI